MKELWFEKYRPKKLKEIIGQEKVIREIEGCLKNNNLPHLLFYGQAGVGKTTTALVIARELFGEGYKSNWMELNASDERGIQTIRDKVKGFAKLQPLNADFKIIFLDEADALTTEAQQSLRRIMEVYSGKTRFILSCNYLHKIIIPIQSRCKVMKFNNLEKEDVKLIIYNILKKENKELEENIINKIIEEGSGDLRRMLNELQAVVTIENATLEKVRGSEKYFIPQIVKNLYEGNKLEARGLITEMLREGFDSRRLLVEVRGYIINNIEKYQAMEGYLLKLLEADIQLINGCEEILVWDGVCFR